MQMKSFMIVLLVFVIMSCKNGAGSFHSLTLDFGTLTAESYTDTIAGGKSRVEALSLSKEGLSFKAVLVNDGSAKFPYWEVSLKSQSGRLNISRYKEMRLTFTEKITEAIELKLYAYIDGFTKEDDVLTYAPLTFTTGIPQNKVKIELQYFTIPRWWYTVNNLKESDINTSKLLQSIERIAIANAPLSTGETTIKISEISFTK